ncbi:MAG: hypothetical protein E6G97_23420 [Alphaproteobacteria bacterium]|nr:MAG: hypothetical protein E6G97_23420 [Alphaproteobacteria bacterium]
MLVQFRGQPGPTEVPDSPSSPTGGPSVPRGDTAAHTEATSDAGASSTARGALDLHAIDNVGISPADWFVPAGPMFSAAAAPSASAPFNFTDFFHGDTMLFSPVAGVVTDLAAPAVFHDGGATLGGGSDSGGVFRGGDTLAALPFNLSDFADNGWHIVPSAANEYGAHVADGFAWDVAAGEFAADWFVV